MNTTIKHTVQEKYVVAGGFNTRYLEAGDPSSTPVLLLHDGAWGGASSVTWNNVIPALAEKYWILAPDMLGFGGTDKAVFLDRSPYEPRISHITAFLKVLGVGFPHVVGNSFGGSLALRMLASDQQIPLRSVISVNGSGGPWRTPLALSGLANWNGTEEDIRRITSLLVEDFPFINAHVKERLRWASAPGHYRAVSAVSVPLPEALTAARPADPWPAQMAETETPILLVAGKRDVLLYPEWTFHIQAAVPHTKVEVLDCKHEPNIDRPELLLPVLHAFLSSVDSSTDMP